MKRVLVTGGAGFAGQFLIEELCARGMSAIGTYYRTQASPAIRSLAENWFECDIRDAAAVRDAVTSAAPEGIVHLAAMSEPRHANAHPDDALDTNLGGWLNVVEAVRQTDVGCRVILISSSHVYGGAATGTVGFHEELPCQPYDVYGVTQASAEMLAQVYHRQHNIDVLTARVFDHCGPRQGPHDFVSRLARQVARSLKCKAPGVVHVGDLDVLRDFTDVRDVVRAYADLLLHGESGQVYNVCSGIAVSLRDVVDLVRELTGGDFRVIANADRIEGRRPQAIFGDPGHIQDTTGWSPEIPLIDTLSDTLHYWQECLAGDIKTSEEKTTPVLS